VADASYINFASGRLEQNRHVCAFFNSADEEYEIMLPFLKEGLDRNERVVQITDPKRRNEKRERLRDYGVDADGLISSGQLALRGWDEAYLKDGYFDQYRMLADLEGMLQAGATMGFSMTRLTGSTDWRVEDFPGVTDLVEYEARLNYVLPKYQDPVICTYDARKFGASEALDILRTHPMIVIGRMLVINSLYVPPDELLQELQERKLERVH
jgi:hypothetical protein